MSEKNGCFGRILLLGIICFAALTLAAVIPSPASTVADAAVLTKPSSEVDCEVLCDDTVTPYCDADEHLVWNADDPGVEWLNARRRLGSHPTTCYSGSCESEHDEGQCTLLPAGGEPLLAPESTDELRQAIVAADATVVQALLNAHPSQLSFNVKRSAIQVMACNGRVREHIPLPGKMVRQLVVAAH
jgi:hypothetical protein